IPALLLRPPVPLRGGRLRRRVRERERPTDGGAAGTSRRSRVPGVAGLSRECEDQSTGSLTSPTTRLPVLAYRNPASAMALGWNTLRPSTTTGLAISERRRA